MEILVINNTITAGSNPVSTSSLRMRATTAITPTGVAVSGAAATSPSALSTTTSDNNKEVAVSYSPPGSPTTPVLTSSPISPIVLFRTHHHPYYRQNYSQRLPSSLSSSSSSSPSPVSGVSIHGSQYQNAPASPHNAATMFIAPIISEQSAFYREKLNVSPTGELTSLQHRTHCARPLNVIKGRYQVSSHRHHMSAAAAAKTPVSYRHLIDLTSSHLRCIDIVTNQQYLCKIINEPLHKVQSAYFRLLSLDAENCQSSIYGHSLIRGVHDIVPLNEHRTYVIIAPSPPPIKTDENSITANVSQITDDNLNGQQELTDDNGVDYHYEDLHTYIRNKRRLCEAEARALFHQICQTVQVCHRNGIILRDLKLKRFYFIDEARTKLQYESLEGSMILDNPDDDTLRDKIGCPLYTAPELLCPNATYRGKPADMWSLGVLLYTMLVGQYPFYEKGNCSLITVIRHCQVQIPGMLSRSVRWLLLALLRKNHEERMCAEHILFAPWLREQRPYYMYIPADVSIPTDDDDEDNGNDDDDDDNDGDEELNLDNAEYELEKSKEECQLIEHECNVLNARSSTSSASRIEPEPLDYTCATLQSSNGNNRTVINNTENDVDMG